MAVYYLKGKSNYGDSAGLTGYYYPLYTDSSLIDGTCHSHTFEGLNGDVFYMPKSDAVHAALNPPTVSSYKGETYQEYRKYVLYDGEISYNQTLILEGEIAYGPGGTLGLISNLNSDFDGPVKLLPTGRQNSWASDGTSAIFDVNVPYGVGDSTATTNELVLGLSVGSSGNPEYWTLQLKVFIGYSLIGNPADGNYAPEYSLVVWYRAPYNGEDNPIGLDFTAINGVGAVLVKSDVPLETTQRSITVASYATKTLPQRRERITNVESSRVDDLIPAQLRESSETLIALLSDYYSYLNKQDQPTDIFNRILSEQDIDATSLDYLDRIQSEIAKTVPDSRTLDKVSLYKRIVKYYSIRGSEESVLVFFRLFFDELVEVVYPKEFLLKPSEGAWKDGTGEYNNRKGFISDVNRLHDSDYWQDYSYQIRSSLQNSDWMNEYLRLVHPAGMKLFAALLLQVIRKNIWTGYTNYREPNPQSEDQLSKWLAKLTPPSRISSIDEDGYHMPFYQPGWLSADIRKVRLLLQALVFAGEDPRSGGTTFERAVYYVVRFLIGPNSQNRNQIVLEQQLGAQKFFDANVRVADYFYLTSNELANSKIKISPSQSYESNLLSTKLPWSLGQGTDSSYGAGVDSWTHHGSTSDNNRSTRNDPFGNSNTVWVASDTDSLGATAGGLNSPLAPLDQNKTYRLSAWVKQDTNQGERRLGVLCSNLDQNAAEGFVPVDTSNTTGTISDEKVYFVNTGSEINSFTFAITSGGRANDFNTVVSGTYTKRVVTPGVYIDDALWENENGAQFFKVVTPGPIQGNGEWGLSAGPNANPAGAFAFTFGATSDTQPWQITNGGGFLEPAFTCSATPIQTPIPNGEDTLDEWYLYVGFLRSADGTTQKNLTETFGGVWDAEGNKVKNGTEEFIVPASADSLRLIVQHDDNVPIGTGDDIEIWGPRIDVVDGNEPSIENLVFPTIDSSILYNINKRPSPKPVFKLNNFSTEVLIS